MNNNLNLLGLAMRARKAVSGDSVLKSIQNRSAKLVIIAGDASDNTKKKLTDKCAFYKIEYVFVDTAVELSQAIGEFNRVAVAITDEGFAKALSSKLKG
ncbi:MAG: L7Ae/L30e/S12e/Gadd45 family ribosomal protein [Erysipelotrichaceae bacterium]